MSRGRAGRGEQGGHPRAEQVPLVRHRGGAPVRAHARRGGTRAASAAGRARRRPWPLAPVCACWGRKAGEAAPAGGGKQGSCWRRGMSREGRRAGKIAGEGNEQCRGGNSPWRTAGEQHRRGGASRRGAEDGQRRRGGDPGGGGAAPAWRSEAARGRPAPAGEEQRRLGGAAPAGRSNAGG